MVVGIIACQKRRRRATLLHVETTRIKSSPDQPMDHSMDREPVARGVRRTVLSGKTRFWRSDEFPGSRRAVEHALSRLEAEDELLHIRRGLYWRGRKTAFGMAPPSVMELARAVVEAPGIGPAGWSATNALGIGTQVPGRETIAVPARAPSGLAEIAWVSRSARWARREERLSPLEVAVLEALEGFERYVDLPSDKAVERLLDVVRSGDVRPERLARAARTEPPRTRRRLRDLLLRAGLDSDAGKIPAAHSASSIPALAV